MEIETNLTEFSKIESDSVVLGYFEDLIPERTSEFLTEFDATIHLETLAFSGKYKQIVIIPCKGRVNALILAGLGRKDDFDYEKLRSAYSKGISAANSIRSRTVTMFAPEVLDSQTEQKELSFISEATLYDFSKFKSEKKENYIRTLKIFAEVPSSKSVNIGITIGKAMNLTRDLANMPASSGTPTYFQKVASALTNIKMSVMERDEIKNMGMGGIEAVSRGAHEPPKLLILEYMNGRNSYPIMFVGKGITFDSGGISLKPSDNLFNLKFDKSGAAAVLGAMKAITELGLKVNVVSLLPLTENLPGGGSYKPGDIITHYNGVTSEVISTDAEGRLVLADAMSYGAEKFKPSAIIDIATLTGARNVALGNNIGAIFSNNKKLEATVMKCSDKSWEKLWPLPLNEEFMEMIRSEVADIKNSGGSSGGTETAAAFLSHFNGDKPWVHLDVQGRTDITDGLSRREFLTPGASAFGTRLLVEVAMEYAEV